MSDEPPQDDPATPVAVPPVPPRRFRSWKEMRDELDARGLLHSSATPLSSEPASADEAENAG